MPCSNETLEENCNPERSFFTFPILSISPATMEENFLLFWKEMVGAHILTNERNSTFTIRFVSNVLWAAALLLLSKCISLLQVLLLNFQRERGKHSTLSYSQPNFAYFPEQTVKLGQHYYYYSACLPPSLLSSVSLPRNMALHVICMDFWFGLSQGQDLGLHLT